MGGFRCTRNFLIAINVLYLMFSVILISVAAYSRLTSIIGSLTIVGGIIACGVFLMLISVLGIIGAIYHHQIALFFYMIIIFLIFLIQFSVAVACLAVTEEQQRNLLEQLWDQADNATRLDAQYQLDCCGFNDKNQTDLGEQQPKCSNSPCCLNSSHPCCGSDGVEKPEDLHCPCDPCYNKISGRAQHGFRLTGGLGLFFSFLEVFGVWFAIRFRNMKNPYMIPENFL